MFRFWGRDIFSRLVFPHYFHVLGLGKRDACDKSHFVDDVAGISSFSHLSAGYKGN